MGNLGLCCFFFRFLSSRFFTTPCWLDLWHGGKTRRALPQAQKPTQYRLLPKYLAPLPKATYLVFNLISRFFLATSPRKSGGDGFANRAFEQLAWVGISTFPRNVF